MAPTAWPDLVAAQVEHPAERLVHKGHVVAGIKPANHLGLVFQDGEIPLLALVQGLRALATRAPALGIGALQRGPPSSRPCAMFCSAERRC